MSTTVIEQWIWYFKRTGFFQFNFVVNVANRLRNRCNSVWSTFCFLIKPGECSYKQEPSWTFYFNSFYLFMDWNVEVSIFTLYSLFCKEFHATNCNCQISQQDSKNFCRSWSLNNTGPRRGATISAGFYGERFEI